MAVLQNDKGYDIFVNPAQSLRIELGFGFQNENIDASAFQSRQLPFLLPNQASTDRERPARQSFCD